MSWIDDYKGAGPDGFSFVKQKEKWGYLNNPRWSNHPRGAADSMSASNFCDMLSLHSVVLNSSTHKPCGHWHRAYPEGLIDDPYADYDYRDYEPRVWPMDF